MILKKWVCLCLLLWLMILGRFVLAKSLIYFPDLFIGFKSEAELVAAKKSNTPEILGKEGVYYFTTATTLPRGDKRIKPMLEKSIAIFDKIRRQNMVNNPEQPDNQNIIRLGYAYMAICDTDIPLDKVMENVSKARNLFTIVIDRLPDNIDARLGRTQININLLPDQGRPDDIILDDVNVFFKGYNQLTNREKKLGIFPMGVNVMRLAAALVWDRRHNKSLAQEYLNAVESDQLNAANLKGIYNRLQKKYRRK
jgi:hypothetical protein